MPELPDVELYLAALRPRTVGRTVARVRLASPFLVRPSIRRIDLERRRVSGRSGGS